MKTMRHARNLLLLSILLFALAATAGAPRLLAAETAPLRILLTNDDGYGAPGIRAVLDALLAAGHEVVVVAPLSDQSGSGMRVTTSGTLDYEEHSPGLWSIDGTPADAVLVALLNIMEEDPPDIVVSGANFGPNLGYANSSGTVGAATIAMYLGYPAIAISVGIDPTERDALPIPFPSTFAAFEGAGDLVNELLQKLQQGGAADAGLLPEQTILNVNYPPLEQGRISGTRVVPASWNPGVSIRYQQRNDAGHLDVELQVMAPGEPDSADPDWQWLARGYATITVLDGNVDAGQPVRDVVSQRLSGSREQGVPSPSGTK